VSDRWAEFRGLSFMPSRVRAVDSLVAFIPNGQPIHRVVQETLDRIGSNRWFPVPGGHELHMPYGGDPYDRKEFEVRAKAWDHETCSSCRERLPAMTSCWVTDEGPFRVLCGACKARMDAEGDGGV
jgi:hypothetical protein